MKSIIKPINIVLFTLVCLFSTSVLAHVGLVGSMPTEGAMLNQSPSQLELNFSAPVRLVKLRLNDGDKDIALTLPNHGESQSDFSVSLPVLMAGNYQVTWMIMGNDGHKMKGQYQFMFHGSKLSAEHQSHHKM
ncbi:copper resistance CopC family protein [Shewanella surugensis]|uniref:Copper resistance protein CopC n=1 Tax=Shewanella surugensis TaxID=212020 RepID=A0ABT0LAV1_9GAMM|nr:copper resistance CopC family protein [Shewanella surugensis]MCL1124296.1 copper resistance protein CopC [Shewanella surugensis]